MKRVYAVSVLLLNASLAFADQPISQQPVSQSASQPASQPVSKPAPEPAPQPILQLETQQFIDTLNKAQGRKPIHCMTPTEARAVLVNTQAVKCDMPPALIVEKTIDTHGTKIPLHIIRPEGATGPLPVIMYFHGGGWVSGNFKTHERLLCKLTNAAKAAIVFVNYSLAPETKYPTQIFEAYLATKWIAEHGKSLNLDSSKIAVAGDSVGGNLAIAVTLLAKEKKTPKIDFQLLFCPVTDANLNTESYKTFENGPWLTKKAMEWFWEAYLFHKHDARRITVSPLQASIKDLEGLPPALIITNQNDVLRDEGEAYAHKLMQAGVAVTAIRYLGTHHDFIMLNALAKTPAAQAAIDQAGRSLWAIFNQDTMKEKRKAL